MSNEVAAAILTQVYFDQVSIALGGRTVLQGHQGAANIHNVETIGHVYATFLGKLGTFGVWATKPPEQR